MIRLLVILVAVAAALGFASSAYAHAELSPAVVLAKHLQVFTLAVPTEKENATTTKIELSPPQGFAIDSFVPAPGWKRVLQQTGSGENAVVTKVTWTGGSVPTGEDSAFSFLASTDASKTYTFAVRQTYSDGSIVDWSGPESSDTPAPSIDARSSFGGGSSTLGLIALIVAGVALVAAIAALAVGSGKRALT